MFTTALHPRQPALVLTAKRSKV